MERPAVRRLVALSACNQPCGANASADPSRSQCLKRPFCLRLYPFQPLYFKALAALFLGVKPFRPSPRFQSAISALSRMP
jgi:hypothetical protein